MNEVTSMNKKIVIYSLLIGISVAIIAGLLFNDIYVLVGVLVGLGTGLIGYAMIVQMALSLKPDEKYEANQYRYETDKLGRIEKCEGAANYIVRYIIYAVIFGFFVYLNISIIALLVGFLCHKLSIFVYALLEGRMDKNA